MDVRARLGEQGAAAVEFALVLPVLVLLIFGIVDFGRLLHAQLVVTEAAREAARAAALVSDDEAASRGGEITDSLGSASTTVDESCPPHPGVADTTTVTVTYQFEFITPVFLSLAFGGSDGGLDVSSTSVMPCLR